MFGATHKLISWTAGIVGVSGLVLSGLLLADGWGFDRVALDLVLSGAGWLALSAARRGRHAFAAHIIVWSLWGATTASALINGGARGPSMALYPLLVVLAGWVLGDRSAKLLAALTAVAGGAFIWGLDNQAFGAPVFGSQPTHAFFLAAILVVSLFLAIQLRRGYVEHSSTRASAREDILARAAYQDHLTRLPNRSALRERVMFSITRNEGRRNTDALLYLNLDRFRTVNHAQGHDVGDKVLVEVTGRLRRAVPEGAMLARLSGDEFAVLLFDVGADEAAAGRAVHSAARAIARALDEPLALSKGGEVMLTASIGVTLVPETRNDTYEEALRRADTALRRAKAQGGGAVAFHEVDMSVQAEQRLEIEAGLRRALREGELRLYAQSQVDRTGRVVGAECLVRWQHPTRGLLGPAQFLAVAEESDLIVEVGEWVLERACELLAQLQAAGKNLRVSVNVSPRQFAQADFVGRVADIVRRTGVTAKGLVMEVTESVVIGDTSTAVVRMREIAALGVQFSLDDFGTGYSSLAYLKRLPVQELKIDRMFIRDAHENPEDAALVKTIIAVAENFGLVVVAEGVELPAHAQFLASTAHANGVIYQGFLYARPEPIDAWLQATLRLTSWTGASEVPSALPFVAVQPSAA